MLRRRILLMDWLDDYAGSEQVVRYLHQVYGFEKVYTLVDVMSQAHKEKIFGNKIPSIVSSSLQHIGHKFRYALPLFPLALKSIKVQEENALIISVTHSVIKGIEFPKGSVHISYLVARNMKYVWEESALYFKGVKKMFSFCIPYLRKFDVQQSQKPTRLIAVSQFVANWSTEKYKREVKVITPPVNTDEFELELTKDDYYVSVGRLEPYKRYDILVEAFNRNGKKLIIIGDGSLMDALKKIAKPNIIFKGFLFPEHSKTFLQKAKAFIFCGKEDFGIALLEPQVCGTPVIAYAAGGALETVVHKKTGVLFKEQTAQSINNALEEIEHIDFNPNDIHHHALQFSVENFKTKFSTFVDQTTVQFSHAKI